MNWKEQLEKDGVAKIEGVFSKEEMDELRALSWESFRKAADSQIQYQGVFPAILFWAQGLEKFRFDQRLIDIVKEVLGDNVLQVNNQVYFRMPGDGDQFAWHQDICFRIPKESFSNIETGYLQTAILIDDMDEENGAIEYVHGSHKQDDLGLVQRGTEEGLRDFDRSKFQGVKMTAKSGDVLVWSVMIVHGSESNKSKRSRMYYMNGFAKTECVSSSIGFSHYLKEGKNVNTNM